MLFLSDILHEMHWIVVVAGSLLCIAAALGSRKQNAVLLVLYLAFVVYMTLAILAETDQIAARDIEKYVFIGELSLDGRIRPCTGVLSMITAARQCGITKAVVLAANLKEAQKISGIEAFGLHTLKDAVRLLEGRGINSGITEKGEKDAGQHRDIPDFSEVRGQRDLLDAGNWYRVPLLRIVRGGCRA